MGRKIISQAAWIMLLVVIVSKRGKATLDIKPTDTVVLRSDSTFFNCSTFNFSGSSEDIAWYHYSVGSDQRNDVYEDGVIRTNYESRFRVEKDLSKGVVNLIVQSPTLEDAGTYECQDEQGIGETAHGQLTVLETEPVCQSNIQPDGVMGSNDCGIPPDQVEMSCSITYLGINPVHLEWRNGLENANSSLTAECSNTTNRSTCNLTIRGDRTESNSAYICQIKSTGTNAYSCSPYVIRILYVLSDNTTISKTDHDEVKCEANSSQQCSYTWSSDDGTVFSTSERLKPTSSGQYECKANCSIRDEICIVTAQHLNISIETTTVTGETNKAGLITGVIVFFVVVTIISTIAIVVWCQYKKRKERKNQHEAVELTTNRLLQETIARDPLASSPQDNAATSYSGPNSDNVEDNIASLEDSFQEQRELLPLPGLIELTTEPDMITLDDDPNTMRARMPCGHVIGPESMTCYILDILKNRKFKFICPTLNCQREWEYFLVWHVACLSHEEIRKFERQLEQHFLENEIGNQMCPGCKTWCIRSPGSCSCVRCHICTANRGKEFDFCRVCLREWKSFSSSGPCGNPGCDGRDKRIDILANCETKKINLCSDCPCIRVCPKCGLLIEHQGRGVHVSCHNSYCRCKFCFVCLKVYEDGENLCSFLGTCKPAPRQVPNPGS